MLGEYDSGYEHYIDSLIREIEKLQDENDKLSEQVSSLVGRSFRTADKMSCIEADNAKLRELVSGLEYCSQGFACDCCPLHDPSGTNHHRCESLERELGVDTGDAID